MIEIPNIQLMQDSYSGFDEEYKFESIINNYKSISEELIQFAHAHGMGDPDEAASALFLADYVITSSEVPQGLSDEERRISLLTAFKFGLDQRNPDPNLITRIIYLSQKVGTLLKRNLSFLSDRGLEKNAGFVLLKDVYITPYLEFVRLTLGDGHCAWELGLLASAIKHSLPDIEVVNYSKRIKGDDRGNLFDAIWYMLKELESSHPTQVNENLVIPNITETKILYVSTVNKKPNYSLWPGGSTNPKTDFSSINSMLRFLEKSDSDRPLLFVNGSLIGSDKQIILARNPYIEGKPLVLFETVANEINLSEILSLLSLRSSELGLWNQFVTQPEEKTSEVKHAVKGVSDQQKVDEQVKMTVSKPAASEVVETVSTPKEESKGIFSKIKSFFKRSEQTGQIVHPPKSIDSTAQTGTRAKKVKKGIKKQGKKKKLDTKVIKKDNLAPDFLAHALGVAAFGDLGLFEIFDTFREAEYLVVGTMESNFTTNETLFLTDDRLGDAAALANTLTGLDEVLEEIVNNFFGGTNQIMPSEIFFLTKDDKRFLITLKGNDERIVGTIAVTYFKDMDNWQDKDGELLKRRSLHMRTGQLLSSRTHTPFDASVERIYGDSISKNSKMMKVDHAILSFDE